MVRKNKNRFEEKEFFCDVDFSLFLFISVLGIGFFVFDLILGIKNLCFLNPTFGFAFCFAFVCIAFILTIIFDVCYFVSLYNKRKYYFNMIISRINDIECFINRIDRIKKL